MSATAATRAISPPPIQPFNSALFTGIVHHQRYETAAHGFNYPLYMLAIDLDEIEQLEQSLRWFASERFAPFSFRRSDYLKNTQGHEQASLKRAAIEKVSELGGHTDAIDRVLLLGQVRCFGLYFSPVNFFFCFAGEQALYMLAEVHNTPWNETHCYLVDIDSPAATPKRFHVSPFMDLDMQYHWRIDWSPQRIMIHIENWREHKVFDATLNLQRQALTSRSLFATLKQWPMMTLSILRAIYWQALKLFIKRVPYHSHP